MWQNNFMYLWNPVDKILLLLEDMVKNGVFSYGFTIFLFFTCPQVQAHSPFYPYSNPDGHIPFLPIPLPLSRLHSLPSPLCFIRCKGPLSRLIRRLEVHFLQILPFYERVIGRKSRRMKLYRQPCTASVKPQSGSGRERNRKEGKKKTT